jgi:hypothetical protein
MAWTKEQVVRHLTPPDGIAMPPYPKERDRLYRWMLAACAAGLTIEAAAILAQSALLTVAAQGVTAAAVCAASVTFLVWLSSWRWIVRGLAAAGLIGWPLWHLGGWAATLAALSIMAAKETHCFHFPAGRLIPWASLAWGVALAVFPPGRWQAAGWLAVALLWWWLAWDRSRLPLFEV